MQQETKEQIVKFAEENGIEAAEARYSLFPVRGIVEQAQAEAKPEEAPKPKAKKAPVNIVNLRMYADNGKAIWEYEGKDGSGEAVECKGQIKDKAHAVAIAKRTAQRCNEFQSHLEFDNGREVEPASTGTFQDFSRNWGDICLSQEALNAVEAELRKAKFQQNGMKFTGYTNWRP